LSFGGSSPYNSTDETSNEYIYKRDNTKNTVQAIQNTVNTSTHIIKTLTHYKTHTYTHPHITKQVKITTVQDIHKLNRHNTIKYPQCKVALMYMALLYPRTAPELHFS
jgi:signal-transduction protein with cAMP-binding, CBS, and nucleotidyltransferase domain